ncbi:MAG: C1 family peptidase [Patescibacteria group bacterium]|mgnify:CR=1 FL=1
MSQQQTRDFLANWENWPIELDRKAAIHLKQTYFKIVGPYDDFDNIRATMYKFRDKKQGVIIGVKWGWPLSQKILDTVPLDGFGHALAVIGWRTINGILYLKIQNSGDKTAGENGYHYVSREVINNFVGKYGAFTFVDVPRETVEYHLTYGVKLHWPWWKKIFRAIRHGR